MNEERAIKYIKAHGGKIEVFKYQTNVSDFPDGPRRSKVLVYNQDRSFQTEFEMTPDLERDIFKGDWKAYVKGAVIPDENVIVAIKRTRPRSW